MFEEISRRGRSERLQQDPEPLVSTGHARSRRPLQAAPPGAELMCSSERSQLPGRPETAWGFYRGLHDGLVTAVLGKHPGNCRTGCHNRHTKSQHKRMKKLTNHKA